MTTGDDGGYDFGPVGYGDYQVKFTRPTNLRPDAAHATNSGPTTDSDYDPGTLLAAVTLDDTNPDSSGQTDALFRPLTAADDAYSTPFRTAATGNVLDNDPPRGPDTLTVTVADGDGPAHGTVSMSPDGTFTYTSAHNFFGTDTFTYTVADGYGLTATAVVTVTVAPPPPVTVAGRVFDDGYVMTSSSMGPMAYDGDGLQRPDHADGGYAGVAVALLDAAGAVVATTRTDAGGYYRFAGLSAGSYRVAFGLPSSVSPFNWYVFTAADAGDDGLDSDADGAGETPLVALDWGAAAALDAGVVWYSAPAF